MTPETPDTPEMPAPPPMHALDAPEPLRALEPPEPLDAPTAPKLTRARLLVIAGVLLVLLASAAGLLLSQRPDAVTTPTATPSERLAAYSGLGTWVSIYDKRAWADPEAAVAGMATHGVRTLYIQTGNSNSTGVLYNPAGQEAFIRAAHARGMKVVAWYLPEMLDMDHDMERITQAIRFRTSDGQSFDSFALDIESTKIRSIADRNAALAVITAKIRVLVGKDYALGGIVPSPVGIAKASGFWNDFPYGWVADHFDVMLPMGYYTYHGHGEVAAAKDVADSVAMIRAAPGASTIPIHYIGGLSAKTKLAEVRSFASTALDKGCVGVSLYSWSGTGSAEWRELQTAVNAR